MNAKSLKICYLAYWDSIHTHRWLNYFAERGHEVHLISDNPKSCPELKNIKLHNLSFKGERKIKKYFPGLHFLIKQKKLIRILEKNKPQILHSHVVPYWGWLGSNASFHPFVISAWGPDVSRYGDAEKVHREVEYSLRKADLVTSDSEYLRENTLKFGASMENNHVIQWGVDLSKFNLSVRSMDIRNKLGLSNDPVIISVRHFRPLYNIDIIVKAFPSVLKEIPNAKLILKNYQGQEVSLIHDMVTETKIEKAVRFVGEVDYEEMPKYYGAADVFVSVPSSDSTSISLLEGMACGTVPIVSDLPGAKEWIKDGENGFIVPVRNADALAEKIIQILKERERWEVFREHNFQLIKQKADYYKHMEKMEQLYYKLLT